MPTWGFNEYVREIRENRPFALARYGDGEWAAIFGEQGANCDGHTYFPQLGQALRETIKNPHSDDLPLPYVQSMVRIALTVYANRPIDYVIEHQGRYSWQDGTVFVDAAREGKLFPLIEVLRGKKILYVGPEYLLEGIGRKLFPISVGLAIPEVNSYLHYERIAQDVNFLLYQEDYDLVGFSAGPTTKVLMWNIWKSSFYKKTTLIDFGSLWDGFIGNQIRSYQKDPGWEKLRALNLKHPPRG